MTCFIFRVQGRCKPNAESLLYAEVQPVLADVSKIVGKITLFLRNVTYQIVQVHCMLDVSSLHLGARNIANCSRSARNDAIFYYL